MENILIYHVFIRTFFNGSARVRVEEGSITFTYVRNIKIYARKERAPVEIGQGKSTYLTRVFSNFTNVHVRKQYVNLTTRENVLWHW